MIFKSGDETCNLYKYFLSIFQVLIMDSLFDQRKRTDVKAFISEPKIAIFLVS